MVHTNSTIFLGGICLDMYSKGVAKTKMVHLHIVQIDGAAVGVSGSGIAAAVGRVLPWQEQLARLGYWWLISVPVLVLVHCMAGDCCSVSDGVPLLAPEGC
jgi:hypothetical protein